jgi:ribulose kinase
MSKKHKYRVFLSPRLEIYDTAYKIVDGSSTAYVNFQLIPKLASVLSDDDFEKLIHEIMRVLDIGAIESTNVRKIRYDATLQAKAAIDKFKSLDMVQYLPGKSNE